MWGRAGSGQAAGDHVGERGSARLAAKAIDLVGEKSPERDVTEEPARRQKQSWRAERIA